jgi:hypothetical protein
LGAFAGEEAAACGEESPPSSQLRDAGNVSERRETGTETTETTFTGQPDIVSLHEEGGEGSVGEPAYNMTALIPGPEMWQDDGDYIVPRNAQDPFSGFPHSSSHLPVEQTESYDGHEVGSTWLMQLNSWQDYSEEAVLD